MRKAEWILATPHQYDPEEIRAFLLSKLSEEAADEFESRLFADDDLLRRVDECEHALADEFVDGELPIDDLPRFQELYRFSSKLQGLVAERRTLDAALEARRQARQQLRQRWLTRIGVFTPFALAAACALIAFVVLRRPVKPSADVSAVAPRSQSSAAASATSRPAAPVPVFFLANVVTRGPAKPPVLKIVSGAAQIELEVELGERAAADPEWSVDVTSEGGFYLTLAGLHPQRIGSIWVLKAPLSVTTMPDRQYSLRATPRNSADVPFTRLFRLERAK